MKQQSAIRRYKALGKRYFRILIVLCVFPFLFISISQSLTIYHKVTIQGDHLLQAASTYNPEVPITTGPPEWKYEMIIPYKAVDPGGNPITSGHVSEEYEIVEDNLKIYNETCSGDSVGIAIKTHETDLQSDGTFIDGQGFANGVIIDVDYCKAPPPSPVAVAKQAIKIDGCVVRRNKVVLYVDRVEVIPE